MSLLDVRNLTVELPTAAGWIRPVNEVSFQLAPAESLGLVGESGSGKTTCGLARLLGDVAGVKAAARLPHSKTRGARGEISLAFRRNAG